MNNIETIIKNIKAGTFHSIKWTRPAKVKKSCLDKITKTVEASNLRIGAEYDHLNRTIIGRMNGTLPEVNAGLVGFEWVEYPTILRSTKTGKLYLRIETSKNSKFKTSWRKNEENVVKALIEENLLSSEKRSSTEMPSVMNIALDSITEIN